MKKTLIAIPVLAAFGGFVLRRLQLANSFDNAGLLAKNDGISIALYCLCALAVILVMLLCLREPKREVPVLSEKMKVRGILVVLAETVVPVEMIRIVELSKESMNKRVRNYSFFMHKKRTTIVVLLNLILYHHV